MLGQVMADFTAESTDGTVKSHTLVSDKAWAIRFSHPQDFTWDTELAEFVKRLFEFNERNKIVLTLSCDPPHEHHAWAKDIMKVAGRTGDKLPIIADPKGKRKGKEKRRGTR